MINKLFLSVFGLLLFFVVSASGADAQTFNLGLSAQPGPQAGQVTLTWTDNDQVNNYNIAYGPSASSHLYGVTNIGNVSSYTIGYLNPGQTYYFVLSPIVGDTALGYLPEVSARAMGGGVTASTPGASGQATFTAVTGGPSGPPWNLTATSGSQTGQVTLTWYNNQGTDSFDLVYGTTSGVNQHGYQGIVQAGPNYTFVVGGLTSGQRYFFSILPEKGGHVQSGYGFSAPVSQIAR